MKLTAEQTEDLPFPIGCEYIMTVTVTLHHLPRACCLEREFVFVGALITLSSFPSLFSEPSSRWNTGLVWYNFPEVSSDEALILKQVIIYFSYLLSPFFAGLCVIM